MIYDFLYYAVPKYDIGVEEIPLVVEWEIDNVPAGYPSAHDPFEEATEPRPLVFEIRLHETERNKYKSAIWLRMLVYIGRHEDELMKEVQESTALQEAFDNYGITAPRLYRHVAKVEKENEVYVYIRTESGLWTVGFYHPDGTWEPESDHDTPEKAAERVHWLNGSS